MIRRAVSVSFLLTAFVSVVPAADEAELDWPREYDTSQGKLILYQPQLTAWTDYEKLEARAAIAFSPKGDGEQGPALGTIELLADTETNVDERQVRISGIEVTGRFPTLDEGYSFAMLEMVRAVLPTDVVVAMDRIVAGLARTEHAMREVELNLDPPPIFVSTRPAILVLLDGEPLMNPIEASDLKFAVNTNWDLFRLDDTWFLRDEDAWLEAKELAGPWSPAGKLPEAFQGLPEEDENWNDVRKSLPGRQIAADDVPTVYVSEKPAELILIDGEPELVEVAGTSFFWVRNTESDLFFSRADGDYYFLVSGRWFRAEKLDGSWRFCGNDLPADFVDLPTDHPRAHVRASIPGTAEATEAAIAAHIPQKATVERGSLKPDLAYNGEPQFEPIEETSLYYATNTANDVIRVGDLYYMCFQAVWFVSTTPTGPWEIADSVPDEIYEIPPGSPVYHTTYVEVYESTPEVVVYGYTSGYWGVYYWNGCTYYGTGWYYPPYSYWYDDYYAYYPYPYTYGVGAYYNPNTGTYGRAVRGYGPYGGWGYGARYNPTTGSYARGGAAYGPYEARGWAEAYNPRTGTYASTRQGADPYSRWGSSVVRRGDDWVQTGHYATDNGAIAGVRTSEGGSGFVARDENNLYAGKDGNVYRRNEGGWQQYDNGGWNSVERSEPTLSERAESRRAEAGAAESADRATLESRGAERGSTEGLDRGTPESRTADARSRESDRGARERTRPDRRSSQYDRSARERSRTDRGTLGQLDRDARSRDRGSARAQNYNSWNSGGRSSFGGRGSGGRRPSGGSRGGRRR